MVRASYDRGTFPWMTFALCAVATAAYAWGWWAETQAQSLDASTALQVIALGGRSTPLVADAGESWRLLSCHFVHTSVLHLVFNLVFLFTVGGALEHASRRSDYAALLLFSAVASSLVSLLGTPQVSAGSSGIVFGVLGAAVTFGLRYHDRLAPAVQRYFGVWVLPFLVILFGVGMRNPGVDHASHLGGLCAGLIGGMVLPIALPDYPWLPRRRHWPYRLVAAGVFCLLTVAIAPRLVGGDERRAVALDNGVVLQVPSRWRPRYGPLGEREFSTAGGMVVLTADPVPSEHAQRAKDWYETHRLQALVPGGRADHLQEASHTHAAGVDAVVYTLERDGVAMARHVHFVGGDDGITVLAFETPAGWHDKYDETRRAVVGSMRRHDPPATRTAAAGP
ncbi:MAG: rhomboid family intramembrane serine protease [Nannocystaceae bacterium]|nr:rhomboid family intramembrane serine protease [bacterium]